MSDLSETSRLGDKPGAWVDLGLTLPVFLVYHLGVVFLNVRNAADMVTGELMVLSEGNGIRQILGGEPPIRRLIVGIVDAVNRG